MRVAVLVIGLIAMVIEGLQSLLVYAGGSLTGLHKTAEGGAVGLLLACLFLIGAAFALGLPRVSMGAFIVAALFGFMTAAATPFGDMAVWGVVAAVLAVLSYLGHRERRRKKVQATHPVTAPPGMQVG